MNILRKNIYHFLQIIVYPAIVFVLVLHGSLDIIVFKSLELIYKKEVKAIIKAGIPGENLVLLKFNKSIADSTIPHFQWVKENEFRYNNEMYDIVKQEQQGDSVYFYCFHDLKESKLFAGMDKQIADHLSGIPDKSKSIKSIFSLFNKYFEDKPGFNEPDFFSSEIPYSPSYQGTALTGYHLILIPPPKTILFV